MENTFESIARIPTLMAACLVDSNGEIAGWCANSAISPESLQHVTLTCANILEVLASQQLASHTAAVAFGERTLIARQFPAGMFIALLDSPVNDDVLQWFWEQIPSFEDR